MGRVTDLVEPADHAGLLSALSTRGHTVATAESLTGGLLCARLVDVPGASAVVRGGVVAYDPAVKVDVLGVPADLVAEHGVVSSGCAGAMAAGVRRLLGATWGVATTGVAGPAASEGHPPGTVWLGVAGPDGVRTRLLSLAGDRPMVRGGACDAAVRFLASVLQGEETPLG